MNRLLTRLRYACLAVFATACVGLVIYEFGWVSPQRQCELNHRWWSARDRECAVPVSLSVFTGRPNGGRAPAATGSEPVR